MNCQEDPWLKQRRENVHKRKQRQKEYQIEQDAINTCNIQREKDRRLLYLYLTPRANCSAFLSTSRHMITL